MAELSRDDELLEPAAASRSSRVTHDIFISYSHAASGKLAPAIQRGLERILKRWYQLRGLDVFRDETNLTAHPDLWAQVQEALAASRFFVLLLSPEAARSKWVGKEIEWWLEHRGYESIILVLTSGTLAWEDAARRFDAATSTSLPPALANVYAGEPHWVDLAWAGAESGLTEKHVKFRDALITIAASVKGVSKDIVESEALRALRVNQLWAAGAVVALAAAFGAATFQAWQVGNAHILSEARLLQSASPGEGLLVLHALAARESADSPVLPYIDGEALLKGPLMVRRHVVGESVSGVDTDIRNGYAAASHDGQAYLWSWNGEPRVIPARTTLTEKEKSGYEEGRVPLHGLRFTDDGASVATVDWSHCLRIFPLGDAARWAAAAQQCVNSSSSGNAPFAIDRHGNVAIAKDGKIELRSKGASTSRPFAPKSAIDEMVIAAAHQVLVRYKDGNAELLDLANAQPIDLGRHVTGIGACSDGSAWLMREGKTLHRGFSDAGIALAGKPPFSMVGCSMHVDSTGDLYRSPDGKLLASGFAPLWEDTGNPVSLAASEDGRFAAASSSDGAITLVDVAAGRTRVMRGHHQRIFSLAFTQDGAFLLSASMDGTVRVIATDRPLLPAGPKAPGAQSVYVSDGRAWTSPEPYVGDALNDSEAKAPEAAKDMQGKLVRISADWKAGELNVLFDPEPRELLLCRAQGCSEKSIVRRLRVETRDSGGGGRARIGGNGRYAVVAMEGSGVRVFDLTRAEDNDVFHYWSSTLQDAAISEKGDKLFILDDERVLTVPITLGVLDRELGSRIGYCLTRSERETYLSEWSWLAAWNAASCPADKLSLRQ